METRCNNIIKYEVTHGWQNTKGEWVVALAGYGCVIMNSEEDYRKAHKDGYIEMEVNIETQ